MTDNKTFNFFSGQQDLPLDKMLENASEKIQGAEKKDFYNLFDSKDKDIEMINHQISTEGFGVPKKDDDNKDEKEKKSDDTGKTTPEKDDKGEDGKKKEDEVTDNESINFNNLSFNHLVNEETGEDGNKKETKTSAVSEGLKTILKTMIADGKLMPLVNEEGNEENIDTYKEEDFQALIDANLVQRNEETEKKALQAVFSTLPKPFQDAFIYYMQGGKDIMHVVNTSIESEKASKLDETTPEGQENIVRQFLNTSGFGTAEEIEDEINTLKDSDRLEKRALQFKPKLVDVYNRKVADENQKALQQKTGRIEKWQGFSKGVYEVLKDGKVNGFEASPKVREMIYNGLCQPLKSGNDGTLTTKFDILLDGYKDNNTNYGVLSEVMWLLSDPEDFHETMRKNYSKEVTASTMQQIKAEQMRKNASMQTQNPGNSQRRGIQRPKSIFDK